MTDQDQQRARQIANDERWTNYGVGVAPLHRELLIPLIAQALSEARGGVREAPCFDFLAHLARQREWSGRTFGPGNRTAGVVDHIRKELREIEAKPEDLSEWIDVVILALDGAWRAGHTPEAIVSALVGKQSRNEARQWPDWRTADPNKAIEHVRLPPSALDPIPGEGSAQT